MERVEKKQVRFAEKLYTIHEVPGEDETRSGMYWMMLAHKRREEKRRKKLQGTWLSDENGKNIFVPQSGLFV
jgi:hypothetical protein